MKANSYHLAVSGSAEDVEKEVNGLLAEGWELYGKPKLQMQHVSGGDQMDALYVHMQALIKPL
jgi:hypothetical protein